MNKRAAAIVGSLLAASAMTGAAVAASSEKPGVSASTASAAPAKQVASSVGASVRSELRVFRAARASDALPAEIRVLISDQLASRTGANWQLARTVDTPTGPLYLVPGDGTICQIGAAGVACGDASKLGEDPRDYALSGFSLGVNPKGTVTVSGIVADDVRRIEAVQADGSRTAIPIAGNAYSSFVPRGTAKLVYSTSDGRQFVAEGPRVPAPPAPDATRAGTLVAQG